MEDLYAKFLPQFITVARSRIALALKGATQPDPAALAAVIGELHALAGEAGLLGVRDVVPLARACEAKAKALRAGGDAGDADALVAGLRQLEQAVEALASTTG